MAVDDSCRKPGAVPFKWEIRPGVPKIRQHQQKKPPQGPQTQPLSPPTFVQRPSSSPAPPQKLKPPPAAFSVPSPLDSRTQSFRSAPRTRSERWRTDRVRSESVSPGCFFSPLLRRKEGKRKVHVPRPESEPGCLSDLQTLPRWSVSSRQSFSPICASPASSSFSSYKSSPRHVSDAEWAGFGLF